MKNTKLTAAVLALIAAVAFTPSAKAASPGDVILGIYDSATTGAAPNSYEVDLGAFSTLTAGETFTLGTSLASAFSSDTNASLVFDIAATGNTGAGGLLAKQIAVTSPASYTFTGSNSSPSANIEGEYGSFTTTNVNAGTTGTSSTGTGFTQITDPNSDNSSFFTEISKGGTGSYQIGGAPDLLTSYLLGSTTTTDFFTILNKNAGGESLVSDGTFELTGTGANTKLIFDPAPAPEPSTYALMLGGLAALWIVNRRRLNA